MEQKINYITPAVTPLLPDGEIDLASSGKLYRHLLAGGVDGILILGSIGEFFGLRMEQKKALIRCASETIQGQCKLLVGTTSMAYDEIAELTSSWARALRNSDFQKAAEYQRSIDRLMDIYSVGKPFVPFIKAALVSKGIIQYAAATKPMPTATPGQLDQLNEIMEAYENGQKH